MHIQFIYWTIVAIFLSNNGVLRIEFQSTTEVSYLTVKNLGAELHLTSLISSENCCAVETAIFDASLGG